MAMILYAVVPVCSDAGQHVFTEFIVRPYFLRILRHADVAFIISKGAVLGRKVFFFHT